MEIFAITLVCFLLVILAMSLGYIFRKREIKGSCGGISALGMEKVCDCDKPCEARLKRMTEAQTKK